MIILSQNDKKSFLSTLDPLPAKIIFGRFSHSWSQKVQFTLTLHYLYLLYTEEPVWEYNTGFHSDWLVILIRHLIRVLTSGLNWSMYPTAWMTDNILAAVHWRLLRMQSGRLSLQHMCLSCPYPPAYGGWYGEYLWVYTWVKFCRRCSYQDFIDVQTQKGTCDCSLSHATCIANGYPPEK